MQMLAAQEKARDGITPGDAPYIVPQSVKMIALVEIPNTLLSQNLAKHASPDALLITVRAQ